MQDSRALQITYNNIDNLHLSKCTSITDYLNKIRQLRNDVKELGDAFTDSQHINKIIKGLTKLYDGWIERYHDLLAKESTILVFKASKDKEKKASTNGDSQKGKKLRDRCTYEPCGKWGHKEENCFLKDPSKKDDKQGSSNKAAEAKTHTLGASSSSNSKPKGHSAAVEINMDAFKKAIIEGKANATASMEEAIRASDTRIETITLPAVPIDLNPNRFHLLLSNVNDKDAEDKDDDKPANDEPSDDNDEDAPAKDRNRSSLGWVIKQESNGKTKARYVARSDVNDA
ncbi:hypothetical protein LTS10_001405 [Elasticomyces elasticus]|nr:hypothetical protein LTS10_001405 [Elasticomyces elasticus]